MYNQKFAVGAAMICVAMSGPVMAEEGHALVIVDTNGAEHTLYLDALDQMEQVDFLTTTIWTEGLIRFSGVPVLDLLKEFEAEGQTLQISALNDYKVEMPTADLIEDAPIVATRMNGDLMPVRDKGPYWIVYPYDRSPEYRTEVKHAQSVWQLKSLVVID